MPFIKAQNGNVIELAEDLVKEFLAQGHTGPYDSEKEARSASPSRTTRAKRASAKETVKPKVVEESQDPEDDDATNDVDEPESEPAESEAAQESGPAPERPAKGAPQSAWAAYAKATGVSYPAGAGRDEIRDTVLAVEEQGADS